MPRLSSLIRTPFTQTLNIMNMKKIFLLSAIALLMTFSGMACTTAIVSGKMTVDGRPLMFKTADGSAENLRTNIYIYNRSGKYAYIGCARLNFPEMNSIFYGQNEKGLAMVNNTAKDLDAPMSGTYTYGNIIRIALEQCATVDEVEALLRTLAPFAYGSNYGCIDAEGNAAYFECGANGYKKYDVNDPSIAPKGYLVRSNYAMSGDINKGTGVARYRKATDLMERTLHNEKVSWRQLLAFGTCLEHGLTGDNLYDRIPKDEQTETIVHFTDYIPRYTTGGMVVIQGVKKNENPLLTTSWLAMGNPLTTVVIPMWITPEGQLPSSVGKNEKGRCALGDWSMKLKDYIWAYKGGECHNYIALNRLINKQHTGILQQVKVIEKPLLDRGEELLNNFRTKGTITKEYRAYYKWVDEYIQQEYPKLVR